MDNKNIEPNNEVLLGRNKAEIHRKAFNYLHKFFSHQNLNQQSSPSLSKTLPQSIKPNNSRLNRSFKSQTPLLNSRKTPTNAKSEPLVKFTCKTRSQPKRSANRSYSNIPESLGFNMKEVQEPKSIINIKKRRVKIFIPGDEPLSFTAMSPVSILPDCKTINQQALNYMIKEFNKKDRDIEKLYLFTKHLKFFSQYKENIVKMLLEAATYQCYERGDVIFREGDDGRHIWVILCGSVSVQRESEKAGSVSYIINSRYDGEVIGEYAIVRGSVSIEAAKRSATCFAGETCHTLRISSEDYIHAVQSHIDTESLILTFISELRAFEKIPSIDLKLLSNTITQQHYTLNQVIIRAGEIPKGMYIIYTGRVRINYPTKIPKFDHIKQKVYYTETRKDLYLPKGMYFGQRILLGDKTPTLYTIVSESAQTTLLLITHHVFFLLFNPYRDETLQYLAETPQYDIKVPVPLRFE